MASVPPLRRVLRALFSLVPAKLLVVLDEEREAKLAALRRARFKRFGEGSDIHPSSLVYNPEHVEIGERCVINGFVNILGSGGVTLGKGVWIASHAALVSHSHPSDVEFIGDHPPVEAPIVAEDHVWIGAHAIILPGVRLGRSCVVAAGAVVTRDVPPYAIVGGIPAKVMRYKRVEGAPTAAAEAGKP